MFVECRQFTVTVHARIEPRILAACKIAKKNSEWNTIATDSNNALDVDKALMYKWHYG